MCAAAAPSCADPHEGRDHLGTGFHEVLWSRRWSSPRNAGGTRDSRTLTLATDARGCGQPRENAIFLMLTSVLGRAAAGSFASQVGHAFGTFAIFFTRSISAHLPKIVWRFVR